MIPIGGKIVNTLASRGRIILIFPTQIFSFIITTIATLPILPTRYRRVIVAVSGETRLVSGIRGILGAEMIGSALVVGIDVMDLNDLLGHGVGRVGYRMDQLRGRRIGWFLWRVPCRDDLGRWMSDVDGIVIALGDGSGQFIF